MGQASDSAQAAAVSVDTTTGSEAAAPTTASPGVEQSELEILGSVAERVLWVSMAMVDHANHARIDPSGLKIGGHQASSASMVSIMTALWFGRLNPADRVSVKPHASPVLHAIEYLLGDLDEDHLKSLRAFGGLQSYPSRTKDSHPADYSTGSVGIGATAPIWGALARRYVGSHFGTPTAGRQYSLVGDAELDEGACWEAILDPMVAELGEVVWIVDLNRQSLDRVVPNFGATRLQGMFAAAGWQVLTLKYGRELEALFARPGGNHLRGRIDRMSNPEYQRLLRLSAAELPSRLVGTGEQAAALGDFLRDVDDETLYAVLRNLGGHDIGALLTSLDSIDDSRPTVILAYTIKGFGLPTAGHPQNHSALLTAEQIAQLGTSLGVDSTRPWSRFPHSSREAELCRTVARRLRRDDARIVPPPDVPLDLGRNPSGTATTQAALGRTLLELNRAAPDVARRVVTVSPDVSASTNLGGWVNKVGVWSPDERTDWFADDAETILHWREHPEGQHVELGIAETNLVGLLSELGATWSRWGEPLLPVGVLYDPFVGRALEPWSFGIYSGGQSILVGTPSGVTLSAEGGAHQSITTPSIGLEQPGCVTYEPAFAIDTEWCLLAALSQLGKPGGTSAYIRLSTRPIEQGLAGMPDDAQARELRRRQVVAGAVELRRHESPAVTIVAMGAVVPEAFDAAEELDELGYGADLICITSPGLLFRALQGRNGLDPSQTWILDEVLPIARARPMVTVLDGHPHTLAFIAGIHRVPAAHLGVSSFGQSGDLASVYRHHGLDSDSIVASALDLVDC
jgi:pyruvate dehydrogenase E1 component